jgi:hypothetical protein
MATRERTMPIISFIKDEAFEPYHIQATSMALEHVCKSLRAQDTARARL